MDVGIHDSVDHQSCHDNDQQAYGKLFYTIAGSLFHRLQINKMYYKSKYLTPGIIKGTYFLRISSLS